MKSNDRNTIFEYAFNYQRVLTHVRVHMNKSIAGKSLWAFVRRI